METDESQRLTPFQLQFDKPIASQIKIAEWNPEKDLLAMVTEDSKILLHRFNWQRLWTISPGKCITSLCWRPDGKAVAVGLEDGTISLHDVENGKLLRTMKTHTAAVVCLNWQEDAEQIKENSGSNLTYEDRTSRFFPPPPRKPRMPGLVSGDTGFMDDGEDSFRELYNSSHQRFNILCSGDRDGIICFSIFGIIPIGKLNIHDISVCFPQMGDRVSLQLLDASICRIWKTRTFLIVVKPVVHVHNYKDLMYITLPERVKVALSTDLCHLIVMCSGKLFYGAVGPDDQRMTEPAMVGVHCLLLDTSIFWKRKNELHQVAQQASNVEDLTDVIRSSLSVMCKQWSDAMHTFHEKFDSLSTLIVDHGLDSTPQEEFLSLLGGARTSPPVHQFLVNSLGEAGLKRVAKTVCSTGKELQLIVLDHLQPAAEIISFRMGELRGLSKWRARYQSIGLDTTLFDKATEKTGTLLVQVERFMSVLSSAVQQFSNFFNWLLKSVKILMSEPNDQLPPCSSELVIVFLKYLYDQDPIKQLLDLSDLDQNMEVDLETLERVKELTQFGGFSDCEYLQRSLAKEFQQMESCFKEAFQMPFATISKKILCKDLFPLFPHASLIELSSSVVPASISYYMETSHAISTYQTHEQRVIDYISFIIPDESFSAVPNCIGIIRGFMHDGNNEKGYNSPEAVLLRVPDNYHCVDLSLYKENQIVLLLNELSTTSDCLGNACMMIVETDNLPFVSNDRSSNLNSWKLHELKDSMVYLQLENEKVRSIPHSIVAPLAVSASRGVACIFAARKRALVYILEEDEDEISDAE